MNSIKSAMTVNGRLFESGNRIRIVDDSGREHTGCFVRTYPDNYIQNRMNIIIKKDNKEKVTINGTEAKLIEVSQDD